MYGVGDELRIHIWVLAKERCFCAFPNLAEKDFRGVHGQVGAAENGIICYEDSRSRLDIDRAQLVKDIDDAHASVPT